MKRSIDGLIIELENILRDMKDTSELMLELAYGSLLFNSREFAEEVLELENLMDDLTSKYEHKILLLGETIANKKILLGLMRIGLSIEEIADAATDLATSVMKEIHSHPIIKTIIEESDETLILVKVEKDSEMDGKTLKELAIHRELGIDVIAVKRYNNLIFNPAMSFKLQEGDLVYAHGYTESVEEFKKLAKSENK